ncbi:DUF1064 domain-containing protein [Cupriavidus sp. Marseille-Q8015]
MKRRGTKRFTEADLAVLQRNARAVTSTPLNAAAAPAKARPSKYGNQATVDSAGVKHDSGREAKRWRVLATLQHAGVIRDLQRQVYFVLAPAVDLGEKRKKPALRYKADFVYVECATGKRVVEDAKGMRTPEYRIKKHLMATVHGIIIQEV